MLKVGVVGATGYTGLELVRLLMGHPQVKLSHLTSEGFAGKSISEVFPSLRGMVDLHLSPLRPEEVAEAADCIFTALPHGVSQRVVPSLVALGKRVVDLSADFRLRDGAIYERYYGPHGAQELLKEAVYGLPELNRGAIEGTRLVANPGCYPTAAILSLAPLIREGWVELEGIVIDAKSGVSGAGRALSITNHYCEANESCQAYQVGVHRHTPEMEQELSLLAGQPINITFTPHLIPMNRGILTTVYATLKSIRSLSQLRGLFQEFYRGSPFIRILPSGEGPNTAHVKGSNFLDLGLFPDERTGRVIVVSALDNLVKGGAGQAIQNMNIMYGFDEATGLGLTPCFP